MTYHLLLVDDEVHAIEGVKSDLDMARLGIAGLYTAHNMKQAKAVIESKPVDIMLCDIEMPQGSGLELLSWVKAYHPHLITIFLTSHADFKYAKEAIQLGSLDYLLKPVLADELEQVLLRAQGMLEHNSEMSRNQRSHQLWMKHRSLVIERFWNDLISHTIPSHPEAIRKHAEDHQLPIMEDAVFIPLLISVKQWDKPLSRRDEKIMEYALKNTAEELIAGNQMNGVFFFVDRGTMLGIFAADVWDDDIREWLMANCNRYLEVCQSLLYCHVCCYLGSPSETQAIAGAVAGLRDRDRDNVAFYPKVFSSAEKTEASQVQGLPDWNTWLSLLKSGTKDEAIREVEQSLERLVKDQAVDANVLHQFYQDCVQALYSFLHTNGIQAHQLYGDETSRNLSETAGRSVAELLAWVRHALDKAVHQTKAVEATESVVQTVRRYISKHIDQDLSRDLIASHVFLNPDYLSRIFKKETGYSISDYVLLERIRIAKELLSQTGIPISSVASAVGHTNFSHFAKIFKKHAGLGPTEYRNQYGNQR
ncbi:response regulator [Paenibacillus sp. 1P07SE]|uniref:response regulator n=1 Tax=Paenibacillus sp. 1P07SE TaxID=3132209 RepID=UPI0039A4B55A